MSDVIDLGLDLENLFQPAWAQGKTEANRFDKFTGNEGAKPERRFSDKPGERRGPRREGDGRERRLPAGEFTGQRKPARRQDAGAPRGKFGDRKRGPSRHEEHREREDREPAAPLAEVSVAFLPDEKGVESIARQIKMTGRAYPLFDIARLILEKPERYSVRLAGKKIVAQASSPVRSEETHGQDARATSAIAQPIYVCALDDTPWLSEDEAVAHVLKTHFATFYQTERTATEPPKGKYTFVAQCGMSGVILGPPNYHDYQNQLRKLHAERFGRMPFDAFKARVKIVKDEAVVNKWVEEQSFKTEYAVLNVPEPLKLPSLEEVEKHFRATHKETIIKSVESHKVGGVLSRKLRCGGLYRVIRAEWEQQQRFPLQLSTELSRQFAGHGLQFFKVNKTVVHVSVARPQFLDLETTPVSESIKRIIGFIGANPRCTRRKLIESLAPSPIVAQASSLSGQETHGQDARATAAPAEPTPEQNALIADLHWLIHQGHVLEFADGRLENAKKPLPRPQTQAAPEASPRREPEKKTVEEKPAASAETVVATASAPQTEVAAEPATEIPPHRDPVAEPPVEPDKPAGAVATQAETTAPADEAATSDEIPSPS